MGQLVSMSGPVRGKDEGGRRHASRHTEVPFLDLRAQYATVKAEMDSAIHRVMANVDSIRGQELKCFEDELAVYLGMTTAVGVSSGAEALQLALLACGIGHDDEVITTAFGPPEVASAICGIGAVPVFVDIDPVCCNLNPNEIEAAISWKTKAVLPVHLYGNLADMGRIVGIAHRYGLRVIEGAGHAYGAQWAERRAGTIGDIACFDCSPDANLGAYGDAGAVVTNDVDLGAAVRGLRDHGERRKYGRLRPRPSSKMDPLQAAVLRVKLRHLDQWNERRRIIVQQYKQMLVGAPLILPDPGHASGHACGKFVVRSKYRDWLSARLHAQQIATAVHYPLPLHLTSPCRYLNYRCGDFPESEQAAAEVLSLPIYPEISHEQVTRVADAIMGILARPVV